MSSEIASVPVTIEPIRPNAPADQNPVLVYLGSLSEGSRTAMRRSLQLVTDLLVGECGKVQAHDVAWWQLRYEHMMKVRADLTDQEYAPATINKSIAAVRQVLRTCRRLGLMSADDCAAATDIPAVRGYRLPAGRALTPEEIERLLEDTKKSVLGVRNRAILMVLGFAGLRRDEVTRLTLEDYDREQKTLRVHGKGNKQRSVPLAPSVWKALEGWLVHRGFVAGPLFYRGTKGDIVRHGEPITNNGVYSVITDMARRATVLKISPHDFRRTFISELLDNGNDIATVAKLVGHSSVVTTSRYDRRDEGAKRQAVNSLEPKEA